MIGRESEQGIERTQSLMDYIGEAYLVIVGMNMMMAFGALIIVSERDNGCILERVFLKNK